MATQINLATLNERDAYIQKIKTALEKGVGQKIVIINISKPKRISGVSAAEVEFVFLGGQKLSLFIRAGADAFKATLNGKTIVLPGDFSNDLDFTFNNAVNGVSKVIRANQKKFESLQAKQQVKSAKLPSATNKTPASVIGQIKQYAEQEKQLDQQIENKNLELIDLKERIDQANVQRNTG